MKFDLHENGGVIYTFDQMTSIPTRDLREQMRNDAFELMRRLILDRRSIIARHPQASQYMHISAFANWIRNDELYIQEDMETTLIRSQLDEIRATHSPNLECIIEKRQHKIDFLSQHVASLVAGSFLTMPRMPIAKIRIRTEAGPNMQIFVLLREQQEHPSIQDVMVPVPVRVVEEVVLMTDKIRFFMFAGPKVQRDRVCDILTRVFPDLVAIDCHSVNNSEYLEFIIKQREDYSLTGEQAILINARIKCLCMSSGIPVCESYCHRAKECPDPRMVILAQPECYEAIIYLSREILINDGKPVMAGSMADQRIVSEKTGLRIISRGTADEIVPSAPDIAAQNEQELAGAWIAEHPPGATSPSIYYATYVSDAKSRGAKTPLSIQIFSKIVIAHGYRHIRTKGGRQWAPLQPK